MRLPQDLNVADVMIGTHKRPSLVMGIPTLTGMIPIGVVMGMTRLLLPLNGIHGVELVQAVEVGQARSIIADAVLAVPEERQPEFLFFYGDDMIPEWWHLVKLYEEAHAGKWDVLAGLYYWKNIPPVPLCWRRDKTGRPVAGIDFKPGEVIECDVVGMDFTLIKMELLRRLRREHPNTPLFKTGPGAKSDGGLIQFTEDVYFCSFAQRAAGAKIGCATGIRVAHLDIRTGQVF